MIRKHVDCANIWFFLVQAEVLLFLPKNCSIKSIFCFIPSLKTSFAIQRCNFLVKCSMLSIKHTFSALLSFIQSTIHVTRRSDNLLPISFFKYQNGTKSLPCTLILTDVKNCNFHEQIPYLFRMFSYDISRGASSIRTEEAEQTNVHIH